MERDGYVGIEVRGVLGEYVDEPDIYVHNWSGDVNLLPDAAGGAKRIGVFEVIYVDVIGAMNQELSVYDVFDTAQTTCDYLELYDEDFDFTPSVYKAAKLDAGAWSPNLLILDRLIIDPEYRGHGVGLRALSSLMLRFKVGAGLIAMKPFPLQWEGKFLDADKAAERARLGFDAFSHDKRVATSKLKKYYSRLGFRSVPKTKFMVLNPNGRVSAHSL